MNESFVISNETESFLGCKCAKCIYLRKKRDNNLAAFEAAVISDIEALINILKLKSILIALGESDGLTVLVVLVFSVW